MLSRGTPTAISFIKSLVDTSTSNMAGAVGFHQWADPFFGLTNPPNSQVLLDMIGDLKCLGGTEYIDLDKGLAGAIKVHDASSRANTRGRARHFRIGFTRGHNELFHDKVERD